MDHQRSQLVLFPKLKEGLDLLLRIGPPTPPLRVPAEDLHRFAANAMRVLNCFY
jgi:hypothetical protein